MTRGKYTEAIASIKEHIAAGDTYQVNYTFRLTALASICNAVSNLTARRGDHTQILTIRKTLPVYPQMNTDKRRWVPSGLGKQNDEIIGLTLAHMLFRLFWEEPKQKNRLSAVFNGFIVL